MGCNAAINALKLARHIVRSEPDSRVLIVSVELCTLHLQELERIEQLLSFLLFGDGCAAAIVSADPRGFSLNSFHAELAQDASDQITWDIGNSGFDMVLSGQVPTTIADALREGSERILAGQASKEFQMWAVHPGGRSVLDAVEDAFELDEAALTASRNVLQELRKHVVANDPVCPGGAYAEEPGEGLPRLRNGLRSRAHSRVHAVQRRGLTVNP